MRYMSLVLFSLAAALSLPAASQDPPGRVGRLAYTQGPVSVYQDPELGWDKAYVNSPVTSENSVWTEPGSRAELRVGATAIRLDGGTQLDIARLDDGLIDATVMSGTVNVRVRYKESNESFSMSTPHARFLLQTDGRYRIDVEPESDESRLTVFSGDAAMETSRGRVRVAAGKAVVVYGGYSQYVFEDARDSSFDRWALARDGQWQDSVSRRYVSTEMTGYEDLDRYGEWAQEPDLGPIWYPRVTVGWTPYRNGHWSYVRPWGWTWIDDEPWGYAPSHYGRWVFVRDRWAWHPGQRVTRPVWAPALVGWIGGSNWNVGVSSGGPAVGWYPLSPWERYEPWYRSNRSYNDRVNVAVRNSPPRQWEGRGDDPRRWNRDRGTTVVQSDVLTNRRQVQGAMVNVAPNTIRNQPVLPPAQVQQTLPQGSAVSRFRAQQAPAPGPMANPAARAPAPSAPMANPAGRAPAPSAPVVGGAAAGAAAAASIVRPDFSRRALPAPPAPAPANQPPTQQAAPGQPVNPLNPAARGDEGARRMREAQQQQLQQQQLQQQQSQQQQAQQREAQQREAQQQQRTRDAQQQQQLQQQQAQQREAQQREAQQQQQRARDAQQQQQLQQQQAQQREAQQREAQQQQQRAREAQQQQQLQQQQAQQREAQQREAQQQQQRAREAQQQQQLQQQQAQQREAQQREAQQRAAQQAQQAQQAQAQERAAREAAQQAQQQQQRAAQQAQQAQERAAREATQQAQQQQQRAAQQAQQAQERAAREAQQAQKDKEKDKEKDKPEDKR
jgi:hypothetical protein